MTTYTFTLPKTKNTAEIYKNKLMDRVITAYPWLTAESRYDYPYSNDGIEYASASDFITLGVSKTHNISWLPKECAKCPLMSECLLRVNPFNSTNYNLETEFFGAMKALDLYAQNNNPFKKDYDFENELGMPVKIFDNFVQIGYDIIPITTGSLSYLKPKTKKTILDITIKIKNSGLF